MPVEPPGGTVSRQPALRWVVLCLLIAAIAMTAAVYFAGTGRTPLALLGTACFVGFGGLGFDLARRRSRT